MQKPLDLENKLLDSSQTTSKAINGRSEETQKETQSTSRPVVGMAVGLAIGAVLTGAPAVVDARTSPSQLQAEAIRIESKNDYAPVHGRQDKLIPGLMNHETQLGAKYMTTFGAQNLDTTVLYYLIRGSGTQAPDSRASFPKKMLFGNQPVTMKVHAGFSLDQHLMQLVTGSGNLFPGLPYFTTASKQKQDAVISSMRTVIKALGKDVQYSQKIPQSQHNAVMALPNGHEVLYAGMLAMLGYTAQPVSKAPQAVYAPKSSATVVDVKPPTQVIPPKAPQPPVAVQQPKITTVHPHTKPASQPVTKPFNPCDDAPYKAALASIEADNKNMMDDHKSAGDIKASAKKQYAALDKKCPDNHKTGTHIAWTGLEKTLKDYEKLEKDRILLALFNVGGGFWSGGPVNDSGFGMMQFTVANGAEAKNPFSIMAYMTGGYFAAKNTPSLLNTQRPHGDILLNIAGENYTVDLSFSGLWLAQRMMPWANAAVTGAPQRKNITGGTEITTTTNEDSGSSRTDGYILQNFMASAETGFYVSDNLKIVLGAGFGQSDDSDISKTNNKTSVTTVQDSEDQGPPRSTVHAENKTDVDVDVLTTLDVRTDHGAAKLGVEYEKGKWAMGGNLLFFYNGVRTSGDVTIDTEVIDRGTNVNIHIDGFPPQQTTAAGSTTTTEDKEKINPADAYSANIVPMIVGGYYGEKLALLGNVGPALGWNNQGYDSPAMPVLGSLTGIVDVNDKLAIGANTLFYSNNWDIDLVLSTSGDFDSLVDYVRKTDALRTQFLGSDRLVDSYLPQMFHTQLERAGGLLLTGGLRVNNEGDASGHASVGYVHQFEKAGPLGVSLIGDSDDQSLAGTIYVPLTHGLNMRLQAYTKKDDVAEKQLWGVGGNLVFHNNLLDF